MFYNASILLKPPFPFPFAGADLQSVPKRTGKKYLPV
jgi:hypothetical protein